LRAESLRGLLEQIVPFAFEAGAMGHLGVARASRSAGRFAYLAHVMPLTSRVFVSRTDVVDSYGSSAGRAAERSA